MISLVRQEDTHGCGIACLAMLLATSYEDAKRRLFGRRMPADPSVSLREINRELRRAGVGTRYDWRRVGHPCVVPLVWPKHFMPGLRHFVVWDPDQPSVYLDPSGITPIGDPLYRVARQIASRGGEPILIVKEQR